LSYQFAVVNITNSALTGSVIWSGGNRTESIDVNGLPPASISGSKEFFPQSGDSDMWHWSERGRKYQLNCYDDDHYAVVVISEYGIGVLVTATKPDTWSW
jgi:hypothetical protein